MAHPTAVEGVVTSYRIDISTASLSYSLKRWRWCVYDPYFRPRGDGQLFHCLRDGDAWTAASARRQAERVARRNEKRINRPPKTTRSDRSSYQLDLP